MSAGEILTKACEFDKAGRYLEAVKLYQDGIRKLLDICKSEQDSTKKKHFHVKAKEYVTRAEELQTKLDTIYSKGEVIDRIPIANGSTGNSYKSLFGKYMDNNVKEILIEDTYIREHFQIQNLIMFLELAIKKCKSLKYVKLKTTPADIKSTLEQQQNAFKSIASDLQKRGVVFEAEFSTSMHDREILLGNGYIISIGRGLDMYKPLTNKYSLGMMDYDFRECKETKIDIFKCKNL